MICTLLYVLQIVLGKRARNVNPAIKRTLKGNAVCFPLIVIGYNSWRFEAILLRVCQVDIANEKYDTAVMDKALFDMKYMAWSWG